MRPMILCRRLPGLCGRSFDQFEIGTNFVAWAVTIARFQVLKYRREFNSKIELNSDILALMVEDASNPIEKEDLRMDALRACLSKLEDKDSKLIKARFEQKKTARELSKENGVAMNTIYRNESRIFSLLFGCIRRAVGLGEI